MAIKKANIVCLFGVKGGIGKSITVMNLAGVASNLGKKILIVDLDLYGGSIAIALNKPINKTIFDFSDDYNNNRYDNLNDYITKYNDNIDFIAAPKDPRKANKINSEYIDIFLDKAKFNYDLILIDTNHILDEINLSILDKSDKVLFMVTNDIFDIKNMKSLIAIFNDLEIDKYKVILNNSSRIHKEYFSLYDIRDIIKVNIDYEISNKSYIKDLDKYIIDGNIVTLNKKIIDSNDYRVLESIVIDSIGEDYE